MNEQNSGTKREVQDGNSPASTYPLDAGLDHVLYEISQLLGLLCERSTAKSDLWKNAWLEAVLVHVRTLADFFEFAARKKPDHDDILSSDYKFPASPVLDLDLRERINKELAHLTFSRCARTGDDRL